MSRALTVRLSKLQILLRGRSVYKAKELAKELNVSPRSIRRDLDALRTMGIRVWHDRDTGGYKMDGDYLLPPTQFTLGEAMALSVLGGQLARRQLPLMEEAWQAITKIRSQLPVATREAVAAADGAVHVDGARVSPQKDCGGHFETIRKAIAGTRKVKCVYVRGGGGGAVKGRGGGRSGGGSDLVAGEDERPFLFRPYALYFGQRAWYAIGHSEKSGEERTLKLNRLRSVEATDRPYGIPDGWTVEKCFGKAWRMMPSGRQYVVQIRFDREHAQNVADTLWHRTQKITWNADGSCLFECTVDGLQEIVWWVMGHGPRAQVIAPRELREEMRDLVEKTLEVYRGEKGRDPGLAPRRRAHRVPVAART